MLVGAEGSKDPNSQAYWGVDIVTQLLFLVNDADEGIWYTNIPVFRIRHCVAFVMYPN